MNQRMQAASRSWKRPGIGFFPRASRSQPCRHPDCKTSGPQNCKIINVCCFQPFCGSLGQERQDANTGAVRSGLPCLAWLPLPLPLVTAPGPSPGNLPPCSQPIPEFGVWVQLVTGAGKCQNRSSPRPQGRWPGVRDSYGHHGRKRERLFPPRWLRSYEREPEAIVCRPATAVEATPEIGNAERREDTLVKPRVTWTF